MKKWKLLVLLVMIMVLCGCRNGNADAEKRDEYSEKEQQKNQETVKEQQENQVIGEGEMVTAVQEQEPDIIEDVQKPEEKALWQEEQASCQILEDKKAIYFCGAYCIMKVDKETGESAILWENSEGVKRQKAQMYSEGNGLLIGDKIYFVETVSTEDILSTDKTLSVIRTDGTGYERIETIEDYRGDDMLLAGGMLYVEAFEYSKALCYEVYEDGTLSERKQLESEEQLELFEKEMPEEWLLEIYDNNVNVISMDEEYVYVWYGEESAEEKSYIFEKVSLEKGDRDVIFERKQIVGITNSSGYFYNLSDIIIKNGYIYYVGDKDYKLYLMRRNLDNPQEEEILGEAFYDSGISEVGTLKTFYEEIYSESMPDLLLAQTDLTWLQVDERFAGAENINRYLTGKMNDFVEYERKNADEAESMLKEYGEGMPLNYSLLSNIFEIAYFDERYLSFYQYEYDYTGGAHGMPFWVGLTFDLQTGERLDLSDIIGNSEEELKEIVTAYFEEYINRDPEIFWEDAVENVREWTNFDSAFYLTEEGIAFYYEPYALASYAAGFHEVVIPYSAFEMKINIGR